MSQSFSKEIELSRAPSNSNTTNVRNSSRNSFDPLYPVNNDNFWSIDPHLLCDHSRQTDDNDNAYYSDLHVINVLPTCISHKNSSNINANHDEPSTTLTPLSRCMLPQTDSNVPRLCVRKLPLHFVDTKDWQIYLEFAATKDAVLSRESKSGSVKNKGNKIQRLLNTIYNIYHEYSELNDEYELLRKQFVDKYNSPDSTTSEEHRSPMKGPSTECKGKHLFDVLEKLQLNPLFSNASTQTNENADWSDLSENQLYNALKHRESIDSHYSCGKRNTASVSSDASKSKRTKIFDHLTRQSFLGQQSIDIIEELQTNRHCIAHKMNITNNLNSTEDITKYELLNHPNFIFSSIATAFRCGTSRTGNNSNNTNLQLINLPILLDLILPKIQSKVQQIFEECSFVHNPLEVMAELRHCNYNKNATVEYFNATKQLRGYIKEFLGNDVNDKCSAIVMRCLYHENKSFAAATSCLHCDKGFVSADLMKSLKTLTQEDDSHGGESSDRTLIESLSKSTDIEPGIFDNAVQDSFSQTLKINIQIYPEKLQEFVETIMKNVYYLRKSIKESKIQIAHLRRQVSSLLKALRNNIDLIISLSSKQFMTDQHRGRIMLLARQVEELKLKLKDEEMKRRSVYNLMQEQMGNVRVYCRCRDIPHSENVLEIQGNESIILPILPQERFDFDNVFSSNMTQSDIYEEFKPLVMSFIDGFNVCFITYGSEASGKTYTLIGGNLNNEEEYGIMQRALNTVLTEQTLRNRDWDYKISACLLEIYNDNCIDILSGETGIQLYVDCGMESVYQKLKSVPITNETDAEVLLQLCRAKRKVARTALNPASSRSHLITLIRLQGKSKIHGENIRSFMCLCDLAGFEDIIKAETQSNKTLSKEAGYINKSLTAFNRVFVSLRRQDPNTVCYRDTKLTHILKPFLTNSGKCALIITIRTDRRSLSSTQNTLRFGRETRGVSLGKARRQVNNNRQ